MTPLTLHQIEHLKPRRNATPQSRYYFRKRQETLRALVLDINDTIADEAAAECARIVARELGQDVRGA